MSASQEKFASIKIFARPRPMSTIESKKTKQDGMMHNVQPHKLVLKMDYMEKRYNFDFAFTEEASNVEVYDRVLAPMVLQVLQGFNCTVLAYGQSGSGKTHIMFGDLLVLKNDGFDHAADHNVGLIPRAAQQLFAELSKSSIRVDYTIRVSMIGIFNEEVRDMLDESTQLRLYDDPVNKGSVCIKDVTKMTICNTQTMMDWLRLGLSEHKNRLDKTNQKDAYFTLLVAFYVDIREVNSKGDEVIRTGQLFLVDTAASENANPDVKFKGTATLNRGIVTLNNVVKALAQRSQHVPYRDSKLTRVLQSSLGGNCKTAIIATYLPSTLAWNETVNNLDFVQIAKGIKNTPQVNIHRKPANLFLELQEEVNKLKIELSAARSGEGFYLTQETYNQLKEETDKNNKKIMELIKRIKELEEFEDNQRYQHRALDMSFAQTRDYLDTLKVQLAEKEQIAQKGFEKIAVLNERRKQLQDTTTTLLGVCNASTDREELYYNKLQEKCLANEKNIEVTKEVVATTLASLDEGLRSAEEDDVERSKCFGGIHDACGHLRDELTQSVAQVDNVQAEMHHYAEAPLVSGDRGYSDFDDRWKTYYSQNRVAYNYLEEIVNSIKSIMIQFDTRYSNSESHSEEIIRKLQDALASREEVKNSLVQEVNDKLNVVNNIRSDILGYKSESAQVLAVEKSRIDARLLEESALMKPVEFSGKTLKGMVNQMLDPGLVELLRNFTEIWKQLASEFDDSMSSVYQEHDHKKKMVYRDMIANRESIQMYSDSIASSLQGKLNQSKLVYQNQLAIWEDLLECVGNRVGNLKPVKTVATTLNSVDESYRIQIERSEDIIRNTLQKLGELHDRVEGTGHAGDTPVKQTYTYPKEF